MEPISQKLTPLQLELLRIYAFNPTEEEFVQVKNLLARFFANRFVEEVDAAARQKGITDHDLDTWLDE